MPANIKNLGSLQLSVTRVTQHPYVVPEESSHTSKSFNTVIQVSEKVLKGKAIENTVK